MTRLRKPHQVLIPSPNEAKIKLHYNQQIVPKLKSQFDYEKNVKRSIKKIRKNVEKLSGSSDFLASKIAREIYKLIDIFTESNDNAVIQRCVDDGWENERVISLLKEASVVIVFYFGW